MTSNNWEETKIWARINSIVSPEINEIKNLINNHLPSIETILTQSSTDLPDFTLHDSMHSFRVAERMVDIINVDSFNDLSSYECALLLLSAYLHDIGMTPPGKKISNHYNYLLSASEVLTESEKVEFQSWLDDYQDGLVAPICISAPTADDLNNAHFITSHYCRFRHNDWSEEWIRNNLSSSKLTGYSQWLEDLITLCKSHHYGYEELKREVFSPRIVHSKGIVVHLDI